VNKKATVLFGVLTIFLFVLSINASIAQQPPGTRLSDDDVEKLIQRTEKDVDHFRDAVGNKIISITNAQGGSVDVQQFLKDYEKSIDQVKHDFDSKPTDTTAIENFFRMSSRVDHGMQNSGSLTNAKSEWDAVHNDVDQLMTAYQSSWHWDETTPRPVRLNDSQVESLMEQIKNDTKPLSGSIKDSFKLDSTVDKATQENLKQTIKNMEKQADVVKDRFDDHKPVTSELNQMFTYGNTIGEYVEAHPNATKAQGDWGRLKANLTKLAAAFNMPFPAV
jgi:hypothetical protein